MAAPIERQHVGVEAWNELFPPSPEWLDSFKPKGEPMLPSMVEMIHADAVKHGERHATYRVELGSRAADLFIARFTESIEAGEIPCDFDVTVWWNASLKTARHEISPVFTVLHGVL